MEGSPEFDFEMKRVVRAGKLLGIVWTAQQLFTFALCIMELRRADILFGGLSILVILGILLVLCAATMRYNRAVAVVALMLAATIGLLGLLEAALCLAASTGRVVLWPVWLSGIVASLTCFVLSVWFFFAWLRLLRVWPKRRAIEGFEVIVHDGPSR